MKTRGTAFFQDNKLVIKHEVDPAHAMRAAELTRQAQADKSLKDACLSVGKIPAAVYYDFARKHFNLSPREALRSHEALQAFLNHRDYSKFLSHEDSKRLINQSFGDGEV